MTTMVITGGSRGIGRATAILAAAKGLPICFSFRENESAAKRVEAQISAAGGRALAVKADVANEEDIVRLFERARELGPVSVLVNNAGILHQQQRVVDMSAARLAEVFKVNVIGSMLCAREAVRAMAKSRGGSGGSIVNVSSAASRHGSPNEYVDYASTKGAIDTFTLGLAKEVADEGIRVNAVRPGIIVTELHASGGEPGRVDRIKGSVPLKRGGEAEEVARAILWLASEEASYCTGSLLDVAGGR